MKRVGCQREGCRNKHHAGGYCSGCYKWAQRTGVAVSVMRVRPAGLTLDEALRWFGWRETFPEWSVADGPCWETNARKERQGYGEMYWMGRTRKMPRLAYEAWVGPIPPELVVRHTCDNPPCINPAHLISGTTQDNTRDKMERGRHVSRCGEDFPGAKYTADEVRLIREMYATGQWTYAALARHFSMDTGYLRRIVIGKIWASVS